MTVATATPPDSMDYAAADTERLHNSQISRTRGMKPLCWSGSKLICARMNQLFASDNCGTTFRPLGEIPLSGWKHRIASHSGLVQRILRTSVYRTAVTKDGHLILVYKGGIFRLDAGQQSARLVCPIMRGSRPTSLAVDPDGLCVFGEYWSNPEREPVHVYGSSDQGQTWNIVYTFPEKSIRHVHGISFDPYENCFWVCTGDLDHETFLYRADRRFQHLEPVIQGGQQSRFFYTQVTRHFLYTATDTPSEANGICRFDKRSGEVTRLCDIENSNFFSHQSGNTLFFSTVAEPSPVNDQRHAHLWMSDAEDDTRWQHVASCATDALDRISYWPGVPSGLFQYPTISFPEGVGPANRLVAYAIGLSGWHDELRVFDVDRLSTTVKGSRQPYARAA